MEWLWLSLKAPAWAQLILAGLQKFVSQALSAGPGQAQPGFGSSHGHEKPLIQ